MLLTLHHIVSDGWSMGVLYRELSVLYEAFSQNHPSPLSQSTHSVCRLWRMAAAVVAGRGFRDPAFLLEETAKGCCTAAITDRSAPAGGAELSRSTTIHRAVEGTDSGLKALSRSHDVTLYMTLLAAFQTLLYRYTGAGRHRGGFSHCQSQPTMRLRV